MCCNLLWICALKVVQHHVACNSPHKYAATHSTNMLQLTPQTCCNSLYRYAATHSTYMLQLTLDVRCATVRIDLKSTYIEWVAARIHIHMCRDLLWIYDPLSQSCSTTVPSTHLTNNKSLFQVSFPKETLSLVSFENASHKQFSNSLHVFAATYPSHVLQLTSHMCCNSLYICVLQVHSHSRAAQRCLHVGWLHAIRCDQCFTRYI